MLPPLAIQHSMVAELEAKSDRIALVATALNRQLDLLGERRQALITASVTGELDLSERAA